MAAVVLVVVEVVLGGGSEMWRLFSGILLPITHSGLRYTDVNSTIDVAHIQYRCSILWRITFSETFSWYGPDPCPL